MQVLALGTFFNALMWMPFHLQLAHGWTTLSLRINLIAVVAFVPAILIVTPRDGARGAAWLWVLLNAIYLTVGIAIMHRRLLPLAKWRWYRGDVARPLAAAGSAGLLLRWIAPDASGRMGGVAFLAVAGPRHPRRRVPQRSAGPSSRSSRDLAILRRDPPENIKVQNDQRTPR